MMMKSVMDTQYRCLHVMLCCYNFSIKGQELGRNSERTEGDTQKRTREEMEKTKRDGSERSRAKLVRPSVQGSVSSLECTFRSCIAYQIRFL